MVRVSKRNWGEVALGGAIILGGMADMLPDEPITIPAGLFLIVEGLGFKLPKSIGG